MTIGFSADIEDAHLGALGDGAHGFHANDAHDHDRGGIADDRHRALRGTENDGVGRGDLGAVEADEVIGLEGAGRGDGDRQDVLEILHWSLLQDTARTASR